MTAADFVEEVLVPLLNVAGDPADAVIGVDVAMMGDVVEVELDDGTCFRITVTTS